MSLLTLFTAPKPFTDPSIATIQLNALESWQRLADVEVLLMGEEDGIAEAAARVGAQHIRDVRHNENGTPLISSMLQLARQHTNSRLLCIVNADMLIMRDLLEAAIQVSADRRAFVLLGRRWDMPIEDRLEFGEGWEDRLRARVRREGSLHRPAGSDFFLFPRDQFADVPDFAVGRAGWDNWMIYRARREGCPVIDLTPSVMMVHQNHDYGHLPGGVPHHGVPESDENIRLAGGPAAIRYTILDATHLLVRGKLVRPPLSYARLLRGVELALRAAFSFLPPEMVEEVARPKRWKKRLLRIFAARRGAENTPEDVTRTRP